MFARSVLTVGLLWVGLTAGLVAQEGPPQDSSASLSPPLFVQMEAEWEKVAGQDRWTYTYHFTNQQNSSRRHPVLILALHSRAPDVEMLPPSRGAQPLGASFRWAPLPANQKRLWAMFLPRFAAQGGEFQTFGWVAPDTGQVLYPGQSVQQLRLESSWLPAPGSFAAASGQRGGALGRISQRIDSTGASARPQKLIISRTQGTTAVPGIPPEAVQTPLATIQVIRQLQEEICTAGLTALFRICRHADINLEDMQQSLKNRTYLPVLNQARALRYQLTSQEVYGTDRLQVGDQILMFYFDRLITQTRQAHIERYYR